MAAPPQGPSGVALDAPARAIRIPLPGRLDPAHAALLVADDPHPFALTGTWAGAAAIAGSTPLPTPSESAPIHACPRVSRRGQAPSAHGVRFGGGWVGFVGYGRGGAYEVVPPGPPRVRPLPTEGAWAFYDHAVVSEGESAWFFEALATPEREAALAARRELLAARLAAVGRPGPARLRGVRVRAPGEAGHRAAIVEAKERIAAGELFQANLCLTLDARLEGLPADAAVALAATLRPAYGAYLAGPWGALASASPELFVRRRGREVLTAPIKGTAPSGTDDLAASAKDHAEHVMIVDLMRNDLGRVCEYGSVRVSALTETRPGAGVAHLVSDVRGTLRPEVDDAALLRATFPPGSVTGAPKLQALRVIADLEAAGREAYTGALGFSSPVAGLELSVVIRTLEITGAHVQLGVGGGITAGSDADGELDECRLKAAPLLAALGASWPADPGRAHRGGTQLLRALTPVRPRPDPRAGIFETLQVLDGEPQRLDAHLDRLLASAATLYDLALDRAALADRVRAAACDTTGPGARLRIDLASDGTIGVSTAPAPGPPAAPFRLVPVLLPGGLGMHKWRDRRLLVALADELRGVPLLVDGDGAVLEAAWATVWLREADALVTPAADGRLLPGVARAARLTSDPTARAEPVSLERLEAADGLALSSALRELVPATLAG